MINNGKFVNVKMPSNLAERLEKYAEERGCSRSKVVIDAVSHFVEAKTCVACGAANPKEGVRCAVCGEVLYSEDEIKYAMINLFSKKDDNLFADDKLLKQCMSAGLFPNVVPVIDRKKTSIEYYGEFQLSTSDGLALAPVGRKNRIKISNDELLKELPKIREILLRNHEQE